MERIKKVTLGAAILKKVDYRENLLLNILFMVHPLT